ncbi:Uncharacterised protein [Streptococcus pneumoniae]|nr:Uncharacterised protein [Streptococcus pneumoniae]
MKFVSIEKEEILLALDLTLLSLIDYSTVLLMNDNHK